MTQDNKAQSISWQHKESKSCFFEKNKVWGIPRQLPKRENSQSNKIRDEQVDALIEFKENTKDPLGELKSLYCRKTEN